MLIVTWNMQGGNAITENKWNLCVNPLFNAGYSNAVCIQECGALPASAVQAQVFVVPDPSNPGATVNVVCYSWSGKFVTFYQWDVNGNRCNLAIVTRVLPTQVWLLMGAGAAQWRPVLGVQAGGQQIFTIHAISPGGADAPGLIQAVQGLGLASFHVLGDYNAIPSVLTPNLPAGVTVSATTAPTYATTNPTSVYDYDVSSQGHGMLGSNVVTDLVFSDHYPARFQFA